MVLPGRSPIKTWSRWQIRRLTCQGTMTASPIPRARLSPSPGPSSSVHSAHRPFILAVLFRASSEPVLSDPSSCDTCSSLSTLSLSGRPASCESQGLGLMSCSESSPVLLVHHVAGLGGRQEGRVVQCSHFREVEDRAPTFKKARAENRKGTRLLGARNPATFA